MKKLLTVLMTVLLFTASSRSGERSEFLDGVVSVAVPAEWTAQMDSHEQTLTFGPAASPTTRIGFSTPSPNHGDPEAMTTRNFDLINLLFDDTLEITEEDSGALYGDKRGYATKFTVDIMESEVFGMSFAFTQDGYMVMALSMALEEDFEKYLPDFEGIIADFSLNAEALKRNADKLKAISDLMDRNHDTVMAELEAMAEAEAIGDWDGEEDFEEDEEETEE